MEISTQIKGTHVCLADSGDLAAYVIDGKIRVASAHSPEKFVQLAIRIPQKDVTTLRWNDNNKCIAVTSAQTIEVLYLEESQHRIRIDNGSGGFGRLLSAEFVGGDQLLVLWEFGRAKLWNLSSGAVIELGDLKSPCAGKNWQRRPGNSKSAAVGALATLSRPGAEDLLSLHFPALSRSLSAVKVPSSDARTLLWSHNGQWLAILDSPMATPSVHFYTADGYHFRTYPPTGTNSSDGLGIKSLVWSPASDIVALTRYDSKVVLLNARTFAATATIEHSTSVDQSTLPIEKQLVIWQETVSSTGHRDYHLQSHPFSPPLSRARQSNEPDELGIAEACFSSDGAYLATKDERTLSTVWIWSLSTLSAHTVIVQHVNIRRITWHPSRPEMLLLDCGEGIAYFFDVSSTAPPMPLHLEMSGAISLSWLNTASDAKAIILASNKLSFRFAYPDGNPFVDGARQVEPECIRRMSNTTVDYECFDEGASEDSLLDVLSGRKPLPPRTEPSYTQRIDVEVETDEADSTIRVDDTFVGKKGRGLQPVVDPLDDSQIF